MEAKLNSPKTNNCHQKIFQELEGIKSTLQTLQNYETVPNTHCCHSASAPYLLKVTEVETRVLPGKDELQFKNRHHLDDTEMKKALRWNTLDSFSRNSGHYEAHAMTFKHPTA